MENPLGYVTEIRVAMPAAIVLMQILSWSAVVGEDKVPPISISQVEMHSSAVDSSDGADQWTPFMRRKRWQKQHNGITFENHLYQHHAPRTTQEADQDESPNEQQGTQDGEASAKDVSAGLFASLDETGYQAVARLKTTVQMWAFLRRFVKEAGSRVLDEGKLNGIVPFYSGEKDVQTLDTFWKDGLRQTIFTDPSAEVPVAAPLDEEKVPSHPAASAAEAPSDGSWHPSIRKIAPIELAESTVFLKDGSTATSSHQTRTPKARRAAAVAAARGVAMRRIRQTGAAHDAEVKAALRRIRAAAGADSVDDEVKLRPALLRSKRGPL